MFVVYWLDACHGCDARSQFQSFRAEALSEAPQFAESLCRRQAQGEDIGFVTLYSENP